MRRTRDCDQEHIAALQTKGWRALTVWECELRDLPSVMSRLRAFLS